MADLKLVYKAVTEEEALDALMGFKEKWEKNYPSCVKSWKDNWDVLSTFYAYPAEIRRIIYTTNIIEGLNRQFRQVTKNKPTFVNDDSLKRCSIWLPKKFRPLDTALPQLGYGFKPTRDSFLRQVGRLKKKKNKFPSDQSARRTKLYTQCC